jgi:hypothetical protein
MIVNPFYQRILAQGSLTGIESKARQLFYTTYDTKSISRPMPEEDDKVSLERLFALPDSQENVAGIRNAPPERIRRRIKSQPTA